MVRLRLRRRSPADAEAVLGPSAPSTTTPATPTSPLPTIDDSSECQSDELRKEQASEEHDWALEQYKTLRQESLQSQSVQHSSLQWGLAITAASITAGVAIAAKGPTAPSSALVGVELLLFGLAVPSFLLGSCLSWLGEVRRMMRTAIYVRWLEWSVYENAAKRAEDTGWSATAYLNWEHALAGHNRAPVKVGGRDWESYAGCALVFAGGQVITFSIWLTVALSRPVTLFGWPVPHWLLILYAVSALTMIGAIMLTVALRRVNAMARVLGYELGAKAPITPVD